MQKYKLFDKMIYRISMYIKTLKRSDPFNNNIKLQHLITVYKLYFDINLI